MSLRARWETLKYRVLGPGRYFYSVPKRERMTADMACETNAYLAEALDDVLAADARASAPGRKMNSGDRVARREADRARWNANLPEGARRYD